MNMTTAGYLILYGGGLIVLGLLGYLSNPEKAKTALMTGGTFGALDSVGCAGARVPVDGAVAVVTTALLTWRAWRASVGWRAVRGQSKTFRRAVADGDAGGFRRDAVACSGL